MGRRRGTTALLTGAAVAVLGAGALAALPPTAVPLLGPDCTLETAAGTRELSREQARALVDAATDPALSSPGALTCRTSPAERVDEPEGPSGLTPRAERVRTRVEAAFGSQSLGGFAPGGVRDGHIEGSAHYDGRAIDVFFRPVTPEETARGWRLAHWLVAHADELDVATVIFDRQVWSAGRSGRGWRQYSHPSGDTRNPVLAHEDHVHVDVAR